MSRGRIQARVQGTRRTLELRGIDVGKFIDVTLADRVEAMLANAENVTARVMDDSLTSGLFGVL